MSRLPEPPNSLSSSGGAPAPPSTAKPKKKPGESTSGSGISSSTSPSRSSFGGQMVNLNKPLPKPPSGGGSGSNSPLSISDSPATSVSSPTSASAVESSSRISTQRPPQYALPATPIRGGDSSAQSSMQSSPTSASSQSNNLLLPPPAFGPPPVPPTPSVVPSTPNNSAGKLPPPVPSRRADLTLTRSRPGSPARSNRASVSSPSSGAALAAMIDGAAAAASPSGGAPGMRLSSELQTGGAPAVVHKDRSESASSERSDGASQSEAPTPGTDTASPPTPAPIAATTTMYDPIIGHYTVTAPSAGSGGNTQAHASSSGQLNSEDRKRAKSNPLASLISSALRPANSSSSGSLGGATASASANSSKENPAGGATLAPGGIQTSGSGTRSTRTGADDASVLSKLRRSIVGSGNRDSVETATTSAATSASTVEPNWFAPKPTASAPPSLRSALTVSTPSSSSAGGSSIHRSPSSENVMTVVPVPDRPPPPPPVFTMENTSGSSSLPSSNGVPTPGEDSIPEDQMSPRQLEERNVKRKKVIEELIDTERDYVMDLEAIVTVFLNPLMSGAIIPKHDIAAIFSNIDTIFHLNQQLLSRFQNSTTSIGQSFVSMADGLKSYSYFMANQNGCAAALERLRSSAEFQNFLQTALADPMCRSSNLDNLLIKPVQRICKYPLLLDQLLRYTASADPDHAKLLEAKKVIEAVCEYIDTSLNDYVNEVRLKEIDASISGRPESFALVAPLRKFQREADLKVSVSGGIRPLHVFLFDDVILFTKPVRGYDNLLKKEGTKKIRFRWKDVVSLNEVLLKDISSLHLMVTHVGSCQYTLLFDTADEKDSWHADIDTAVNAFLQRQYNEIYGKVAESERAPFTEFKRRLRKQLESIPLPDAHEKSGKASSHNSTWRRLEGDDDD